MKFWEILSQPPRDRDPVKGQFTKAQVRGHATAAKTEERIRALAKATDDLSPAVKNLAMILAKSDLTSAQVETMVRAHRQRDDLLKGYNAIVEAMKLRPGSRAKAFLKRKGEDL